MTGLERAVSRLDAHFGSLPLPTREAFHAMFVEAWPIACKWYGRLDDILSPAMGERLWDVATSLAWLLPRGRTAVFTRLIGAIESSAPNVRAFAARVSVACKESTNGLAAHPAELPA